MTLRGGIDLGGTKILAVVVNDRHRVLGEARRLTPTTGGPAGVATAMVETLREAASEGQVDPARLSGVGVGSPGVVDGRRGTVAHASNLPGWSGTFALAKALSSSLGVSVRLGNDVGVAVDAESSIGAGKGRRSMLGVWWGTGVGGGVVFDGKRWLGRGAAGEIGHMVVHRDGARCPCGRRGCLEAYAGRRAMEAEARRLKKKGRPTKLFHWMKKEGLSHLTSGLWARGVRKKDPIAVKLVSRAEAALAAGIASVVNLLDLEVVVIGGGMGSRMGFAFTERLSLAMRPHLFVPERPPLVRVAALGDLAGAVGASLLVTPTSKASRKRDALA
jgi:glucokinase